MRLLIALLGLVLCACQATTGKQAGLDAFDDKRYDVAYKELLPFAEKGDTKAQAVVGTMLVDGKGTTRDVRKGVQMLTAAAQQGDAYSQVVMGSLYGDGVGVPKNDLISLMWLTLGAG